MKHIRFLIILLTFSYSVFALTANETNLFNAINEKNSDNVSNILNNSTDIDINVLDDEGYTPLHRAVLNKDLNTLNVLLENESIDINSKLDMKVSIEGWYLGGATPLILASYIGDTNIVSVLLENNADIKAQDDVDGSMAIHMASANGNNDVVMILLDKDPTTINDVDNRGNTPLHWAAMKDKPETVKLLMENGADIESKDADGWTPLHYAAAFSSLQTVQTLVDLGADKMSKTKDGNEPIYYAKGDDVKNYLAGNDNIAREGTPEDNLEGDETVVADNNTADENNNTEEAMNNEEETVAEEVTEEKEEYAQNDTAEEEATAENEEEVVEEQTEEVYVDNTINAVDLDVKQLELLVAVKNNDIIALNTLIKEGVNPNFIDENGYTPLHLAVINSNLDTVEALLKYKDINKEAKLPYKATLNNWYLGGATPLIVASYVGNADIVYTLLEAGCDIRARDDIDGAMPIHVASANGNDDAVILLLEKDKTLVNEADKNGNDTPLHWAAMKNKPSTINVLLKYGADTKIQNSDGNTALHYAAMYGVNMANNENMYPIHYAALENNVDALVALVQDGKADVNIKDSNNDTALHYAAAYGNMDSVMSLVEKCYADKTLKDNDGYTAADLASDNGYENIANYLKGAAYIPDNNTQDNTGNEQELILPEYNKKPNLDKKWW